MNEKNRMIYLELMARIKCEIFNRQGSGFTVELLPDIDDVTIYKYSERVFNGNKYWKKDPNCRYGSTPPNDWYIRMPLAIQMALPKEIKIHRSLPTVIEDTRETAKLISPKAKAHKITGRKVYLTVSDNYAAKVYREVYTDIGIPFRDALLTKHHELLQEIILEMNSNNLDNPKSFKVSTDSIGYYYGSEDYYIVFERKGMKPLASTGQMYGMALALIEVVKKCYPECLLNRSISISSNFSKDYVKDIFTEHFWVILNAPTIKEELKEW